MNPCPKGMNGCLNVLNNINWLPAWEDFITGKSPPENSTYLFLGGVVNVRLFRRSCHQKLTQGRKIRRHEVG
ncbi:hypothetical protein Xbed_00662 [Xenorhabdus beddingii]|uniref:Uncharacterized protein n=1 Tax=Xenorhabdus beddingii TaxID=40578 RepID=A0A1Y2SRH9_9GAMM|nr:hypothetical protein Xbed_00662 [Xenorhabdus beddingii]